MTKLILASGSVARATMLRNAGVAFTILPPGVDEAACKRGFTGGADALALHLASAKAKMVAAQHPKALVIGGDQLLLCEGRQFDKPANAVEAAAHLRALSGRMHTLVTAACVYQGNKMLWSDVAHARLTMRPLSEAFVARYMEQEGEAACASVGAYRLEGLGAQLFTAVEGEYFTILGLNLLLLLAFLRESGVLAA